MKQKILKMPCEFKNQSTILYCYLFCCTVVEIVDVAVVGYSNSITASLI